MSGPLSTRASLSKLHIPLQIPSPGISQWYY